MEFRNENDMKFKMEISIIKQKHVQKSRNCVAKYFVFKSSYSANLTLLIAFFLTIILDPCLCISHKYVPEFNDKLTFDISWKGTEPQVGS